ncbi:hypothetical protein [Stieleria sp.]|uniref:Uncharacterized protein n=1 Tax=Stieleria magnilauensis TaxID=2527963 RepID=A0ABX5XRB4_9BACT|nr:hypothetical protein [Phycisphaera sp. RhM]QDV83930.1 hypothetical protein TBK1r_28730 [Planctomycetes bacterium TBK1r]
MKKLIEPQLGNEIGINIHSAHRIESATLLAAEEDYFSVRSGDDANVFHVPYVNIVKVIENPEGVTVSGFFKSHKTHPFVIKIGHVVEYVPT